MIGVAEYALWLGDDALIRSQRLCHWLTRAPELEEEVALANIALDLLGQARALLSYGGRDEDAMAYRRAPAEYRSVHLVERHDTDFAVGIARQLAFSAYQLASWTALLDSRDETIAAVAGKATKEVSYHLDHAVQWTLRLGDGTEVSHRRMDAGLAVVWPDVPELFAPAPELDALAAEGVAVDPAGLAAEFEVIVRPVLQRAGLRMPAVPAAAGGGRHGVRTPEFVELHRELTELHLAHPGASW
ncbi:MAG: 1,2-phenylacetyl-CoA epoxidase subunit PaaC [Sporichthyaceae bacterium]